MKHFFTSLLLLIVGVMTAQAADKYLKIGDKNIDLTKDGTYTSIGTTSGTATYTASSKTLVLNNVTLKDESITGNELNDGIYVISLKSNLTIKHTTGMCMRFDYSKIRFEGNGHNISLNNQDVTASGRSCFDAEESAITIWNAFLYVSAGGSNAIYANAQGTLSLSRVSGYLYSKESAAIKGFESINTDDCYISTTGKFVSGTGYTDNSGNILKSVTLRPYLQVGNEMVRTAATSFTGTNWTWNKSTKTLTLTDAKIQMPGNSSALQNYQIDGLTVQFKGQNELSNNDSGASGSGSAFFTKKSTTIKGDGVDLSKAISLKGYIALYVECSEENTLTIENACILADGGRAGICGSAKTKLVLKATTVLARGLDEEKGYGAIVSIKSCTMEDCGVATSINAGVAFRSKLKGFGTNDKLLAGDNTLWITKPTTKHQIEVLGTPVTDLNLTDVAVDGLTAGKISFNKDTKTLTLDGVKIDGPSVNSNSRGLFISAFAPQGEYIVNLKGENTVTSYSDAIYTCRDVTFTGSGSGIFTSTNSDGFFDNGGSTTTLNTTNVLGFEGARYGFGAGTLITQKLVAKKTNNTVYKFKGGLGAFYQVHSFDMTGLDFYGYGSNLKGCYYDEETQDIRQNGNIVAKDGWVAIGKASFSDIFVGGVPVSNLNVYGIGSKYITSSPTSVTYNNMVLTLDNATIDYQNAQVNAIRNKGINNLTINLVGENKITSSHTGYNDNNTPINVKVNTTITGSGKLTVDNLPVSVGKDATLTFKDAKDVTLKGIKAQQSNSGAKLVVNNSNVTVNGTVFFFDDVTWPNGHLLKPVGGKYDKSVSNGYIVDANGNKANLVVFGDKNTNAIDAVEIDNNADVRNIYNVNGRQMNGARKGLNIIRMNDGTVRKVMVK